MVTHTGSSLIDEMGTARRPWMDPLESIISSSKSSPELSGRLSMTNAGLINLVSSLYPTTSHASKRHMSRKLDETYKTVVSLDPGTIFTASSSVELFNFVTHVKFSAVMKPKIDINLDSQKVRPSYFACSLIG